MGFFVASDFTSLSLGADSFWFSFDVIMLVMLFLLRQYFYDNSLEKYMWPLTLFLIWVMVGFIRGVIVADNYWDWKNLIRFSMTMLLPAIAFLATNPNFVQKLFSYWFKYGLWLFFLFVPFIEQNDFYGAYLAPLMLFMLMFPLLPFQWKIIIFFLVIMVVTAGVDSRSNLIRFLMAIVLAFYYYVPIFKKVILLRVLHLMMFILPIVLLTLAITNVFNVFKMDQYLGGDISVTQSSGKKESLTVDTRTFIYTEVITSALKNNYVFFGRTPARGYDSPVFGKVAKYKLGTGRMIRYSSEVSMCNIFTWYGIVGVILYSLVFMIATYLALYRSNNYFIKVIGVFVAFRWAYSFVEEFTRLDILMALLWIMIGMCFSSTIRAMSDVEFKLFIKKILPRVNL